jgi:hypothetical protein
MAARTIVTSHPDVACDVCGRRLLRGEQPDTFLGAGRRRVVCELCTTRAAQEGWRRESEQHAPGPRAKTPRGGRSLLDRLRQTRRAAAGPESTRHETPVPAAAASEIDAAWMTVEEEPVETEERWGGAETPKEAWGGAETPEDDYADADAKRAVAVFNAGEHPRRLAGVMRALGEPAVKVAPITGAAVGILVAWELCWYRYEVDLGDEARGARLTAEGTELAELEPEDLLANALMSERGELSTTR